MMPLMMDLLLHYGYLGCTAAILLAHSDDPKT